MDFPTNELDARLLFNQMDKVGPVRFAALVRRFGSAVGAIEAGSAGWREVAGFGEKAEDYFASLRASLPSFRQEKIELERLGARALCSLDEEYPESFRRLHDAPPIVYVRGRLAPEDQRGVALVGSRRASPYGLAVAERLGRELAQAGVTVISGLARGVDGAAHGAAVKAGGRSVGILGSGFDRFYPSEHLALADKMAAHGAVLTEFPLRTSPDGRNFPRRNRLIAALALGVVVVEAFERSGALITAGFAAEQGREVMAVPGSVFSPLSSGPHRLIRDGAIPVTGVQDILDNLPETGVSRNAVVPPKRQGSDSSLGLGGTALVLLESLSMEPRGIDLLSREAGLSSEETSRELLKLELAGLARSVPGKQFVRTETSYS